VAGDLLAKRLDRGAAKGLGLVLVADRGERVDLLVVDQDAQLDELALGEAGDL